MSSHTPGPWRWWTSNSWKRLKHDVRGLTLSVLEPYVCRDGHADVTVSDSDMRLIAAAPDLLAALKGLMASLESDGPWRGPNIRAARAAIAKATGDEA